MSTREALLSIVWITLLVALVGCADDRTPASALPAPDAAQESDASRVLIGHVVFPKDTPMDERAEAVLRVEHERDESRASPPDSHDLELARVPVERDGSFRLPRPDGVRPIRVSVEGDYLVDQGYCFEPGGAADPFESPIVLEPTLGAHVTFVFVPPPDLEERARALIGRALNFTWSPRGTTHPRFEGRLEIAADLTAVLRAQPPAEFDFGSTYALAWYEPLIVRWRSRFVSGAGVRERFELPLIRCHRFAGRVLNTAGAPLAGATVRFWSAENEHWLPEATSATTDAKGQFRALETVWPVSKVEVMAQDHRALELKTQALTDSLAIPDRLEFMLQHCARIRGTVRLADGRPVAGLILTLIPDGEGAPRHVRTDSMGRFEADGLGLVPHRVAARGSLALGCVDAPGVVELSDVGSELAAGPHGAAIIGHELALHAEGLAPSDTDHQLVLASSGPGLSLRVVDDSGAPVENFHLVLERGGKGTLSARDLASAGARGSRIHAPGGMHRIEGLTPGALEVWVCTAPVVGGRRSEIVPLTIGATESPRVELVLPGPGTISGQVALPEGADQRPFSHKAIRAYLVEPPLRHALRSGSVEPDGSFQLEWLPPGHYELELMADEFVHASIVELDLAPAEQRTGVTIATLSAAFVDVRVLGHNGEPAVGQHVEIRRADGADLPPNALHRSPPADANGFVRRGPFSPGELVVSTLVSGGRVTRSVTARVVVEAGRMHAVTLSASSVAPCTAVGTVTSAGAPCVRYRVHFNRVLGGEGGGVTDASGSFRIDISEGGAWTMTVQDPFRNVIHQREVVLPERGELLLSAVLATGEVRGRLSPSLLPGDSFRFKLSLVTGDVAATNALHRWPSTQPLEDGTFLLQHLPSGRYRIIGAAQAMPPDVPARTAESAEFDVGAGFVVDGIVVEVTALR